MSTSLLACMCVCLPVVVTFDYVLPQQVYQVTRWEAHTEHASRHGPSHSAPTGRSYSYRTDWTGTGQQRQRSPVTQRRVYSRESNWPSETGFDSLAAQFGPLTYQPNSADYINPQVSILHRQLNNRQPFESNISPDPAYWAHSSQENSGDQPSKELPTFPQVQNIYFRQQTNRFRNTDVYHKPSIQSQFSLSGKENPPSQSALNRGISEDVVVNLPKQNSVKLRTTQESYFGKDNDPEQSILHQLYVEPPFTQPLQTNIKHGESYDEELIKQIKSLKVNEMFPQAEQGSFLSQPKIKGQIYFDISPSLNELIKPQSSVPEQTNPKSKIQQPTTLLEKTNKHLTLSQFISSRENTNWFEPYNPTVSDPLDDTLHHERVIPVRGLTLPITTPSPYTIDINWHNIQNQGVLHHDEIVRNNNKAENFYPNGNLSVSFRSTDIASNLLTTNTVPQVDDLIKLNHGLTNVEENSEATIQQPGQWESCVGPKDSAGHCVPAELCDLEDSYHHYSTTQKHYCIIRHKHSWDSGSHVWGLYRDRTGNFIPAEPCDLDCSYHHYLDSHKHYCIIRHKQSIGICCVNLKKDSIVQRPSITVAGPGVPEVDHTDEHADHDHHDHDHHDHDHHDHHDHHHEHCIYPIADYKVCGRSGKMMSNITTQATATVRDWPWSAVLVLRSTLSQFCGGTLITRRHVLTAAHCFRTINPDDTLVLLGDYDVRQANESQSRVFAVERLISNDDYDPATHENDIALLVLNTTTVYNNYIQPACLPVPGPRYTNETSVLTGWGRIQYRGQLPTNLMEAPLPVWDQDMCIPRFAQTIFNNSLCAGAFEGGRDSCQGDSGGSLVKQCHHNHRWVIIGIVSWGIRCGERDKPGVYTRVNDYLDWIHENIIDNSTDTANTTIVDTSLHIHHFL